MKREDAYAKEFAEPNYLECPFGRVERVRETEKALEKLPEAQREVVVLRIWAQLSFSEIGESLEISPNTASSRYRYALATLKSILAEDGIHV